MPYRWLTVPIAVAVVVLAGGCGGGGSGPRPQAVQPVASSAAVIPAQGQYLGDLDNDGQPSVGDAIKILRIVVALDDDDPCADANQSGQTDVGDAILVLRCVVGLDEWPIGEAGPTEEQLETIAQTSQSVSEMLDLALEQEPLAEALAEVETAAGEMTSVEAVQRSGTSLAIKHREGGIDIWAFRPAPTVISQEALSTSICLGAGRVLPLEYIGAKRAMILRTLTGADPGCQSCVPIAQQLQAQLENAGLQVVTRVGPEADVDAFRYLWEYGFILIEGHGAAFDAWTPGGPWDASFVVSTGEAAPAPDQSSWLPTNWPLKYWDDWVAGRITRMAIPWGTGSEQQRAENIRWVWAVTENFFHQYYYYFGKSFADSLVFMVSCESLKNEELAKVLNGLGVNAYLGWSDITTTRAWLTGLELVCGMRCSRTLGEAFDSLPLDLRRLTGEYQGQQYSAELLLYPLTGRSLQLTDFCPGPPEGGYEFVTKWGSEGTGDGQFKYPSDVAVDSAGNVYVADRDNHRIQKFTTDGTFLTKWGSQSTFFAQLDGPLGVAVDAAGNVYVADSGNHCIQKFTSDGIFLTRWGSHGSGDGQFCSPSGVAVDGAGNVYAIQCSQREWWAQPCVQKFASDGTFLAKWGSWGSADGQFYYPSGVAVDAAGNMYVADWGNFRVQKFTSYGWFLTKWGFLGSGDGRFNTPWGVAVDAARNVYVADSGNHRIQKFTSDGTFLTKWGTEGSGDGQFYRPHGVAVDAAGNVYVAELANNRIQKFRPVGP